MTPIPITALFALLAALQLIDIAITLTILKGGGREVNPIMAKLMDLFDDPAVAMLLVKGAMLGLVWWFVDSIPVGLLGALVAFYIVICVHNWNVMKGMKL
jgi:hypothetical protein